MKTKRTLVFSLLFVLMGLSLMLGSPGEVNALALTSDQWKELACYMDRYIGSQYSAGPDTLGLGDGDNEYRFIHTPAQYKAQVDNDPGADGILCGVGDDMKDRPVLVDNLLSTATLIPGTSIRNVWNTGSTTIGGMSPTAIAGVKAKVNAHREAGFNTDISIY